MKNFQLFVAFIFGVGFQTCTESKFAPHDAPVVIPEPVPVYDDIPAPSFPIPAPVLPDDPSVPEAGLFPPCEIYCEKGKLLRSRPSVGT